MLSMPGMGLYLLHIVFESKTLFFALCYCAFGLCKYDGGVNRKTCVIDNLVENLGEAWKLAHQVMFR